MAITVSGVENFYANRFDVALKDDRIMTATADGYHLQACLGEVKITNSIIENTHDDALNIKSGYYYSAEYGRSCCPYADDFQKDRALSPCRKPAKR